MNREKIILQLLMQDFSRHGSLVVSLETTVFLARAAEQEKVDVPQWVTDKLTNFSLRQSPPTDPPEEAC